MSPGKYGQFASRNESRESRIHRLEGLNETIYSHLQLIKDKLTKLLNNKDQLSLASRIKPRVGSLYNFIKTYERLIWFPVIISG